MNPIKVKYSLLFGWVYECQVDKLHRTGGFRNAAEAGDAARKHLFDEHLCGMAMSTGRCVSSKGHATGPYEPAFVWYEDSPGHAYRCCPDPYLCPDHRIYVV